VSTTPFERDIQGRTNALKTAITVRGGTLRFAQRGWVFALIFAVIGAAVTPLSIYPAIALWIIALLYGLWRKELEVDTLRGAVRLTNGVLPFAKTTEGTLADLSHVELEEVRQASEAAGARTTLVTWRVVLHGLSGKLDFPIWQDGDKESCEQIARALATACRCEVR
jgi:hypothetical protein